MSKLAKFLLHEVASTQTGPFGSQLHEEDYVSNGTPIVTVEHLGEVGFNLQNLPLVSDKDKERLSKYILKEGDIVFSRVGSIDRSTYVSPKEDGWLFSGRCLRVRANEKVNPIFLSYYFKQKYFKEMMLNVSVGATMPSLNTALMANIPLFLPELKSQRQIAQVLSSLDDKIELNNKINAELEAMAKTLYDYWFVQFDFPNEDGKPYKASGGKMVWSEELKREIPAGWEVVCLEQIVNIFDSKRIPLSNVEREKIKGVYPYYGATGIMDYIDKYIFDDDYILIAEDGSVMDIKGNPIVQFIWGKTWVNNHAHILQHKNKSYNEFLFYYLKTVSVIQIMTGSIQKKINQENLLSIKLPLPNVEVLDLFVLTTKVIRKKIINIIEQNQQLSELRDWLLPMLMNGQVGAEVNQTLSEF